MRLNFDDVKETKNSTEGEHTFTIVGAKEATSLNGTNMLVLVLKDEEEGIVSDRVCLEGPGAFRAKNLFKALSISDDEAKEMQATDLIGMTIDGEVAYEEYEGVERAKIKKYL